MKTIPKVGDWVVSLVTESDVEAGNVYRVERILNARGSVLIRDDVRDWNCLTPEEYALSTANSEPEPPSDTYQVSVPVPRGMRLKTVTYAFIDD